MKHHTSISNKKESPENQTILKGGTMINDKDGINYTTNTDCLTNTSQIRLQEVMYLYNDVQCPTSLTSLPRRTNKPHWPCFLLRLESRANSTSFLPAPAFYQHQVFTSTRYQHQLLTSTSFLPAVPAFD